MKKLLAGLLAVMMLFALTACSNSGDGNTAESTAAQTEKQEEKQLYAGYYSANIPEGFTMSDDQEEIREEGNGSTRKIFKIMIDKGTPESESERRMNMNKEKYTKGDDITIGAYTYKVVNFEWNGVPSAMLYTNAPGVEDKCIIIDLFCMVPNEEPAKAFLESLKIEDNADAKNADWELKN